MCASVAAEALGEIGDASVAEPLIAALKDYDRMCRQCAVEALEKIAGSQGKDEAGRAIGQSKKEWAMCIKIGGPAGWPLIARPEDSDQDVRWCAAEALGRIGDAPGGEAAHPPAFEDSDQDVRKSLPPRHWSR